MVMEFSTGYMCHFPTYFEQNGKIYGSGLPKKHIFILSYDTVDVFLPIEGNALEILW